MGPRRQGAGWSIALLGLCGIHSALGPTAGAQDDPPSPPRPSPKPAAIAPSGPPAPQASAVEQLGDRVRVLEELNRKLAEQLELNRKLAEQLEKTNRENREQMARILEKFGDLSKRVGGGKDGAVGKADAVVVPPPPRPGGRAADPASPVPNYEAQPVEPGPPVPAVAPPATADEAFDLDSPVPDYTEGQFAPFAPPPGVPPAKTAGRAGRRLPLYGTFGPGFQFQTEDEKFRLQVHYESQIEGRAWAQRDQVPANGGIFLPRQRIFFNGNITKAIEYEFAINRGFGNLNVLNAFVNLHFDDRFEVRLGRFFTPLDYDQYAISNYWLPTPERSIFTTNVGLNRQFGLMGWGYLFDKRLDYAAGIFNGSRNSFESLNNSADFVTYLNARPFQESEALPRFRFLNLGTSFAFGRQDQSPVPVAFRIAGGSPTADNPGPGTVPFLILNRDVVERGNRLLGSVHAAYFYKSLSLIGEWQHGYGNYASLGRPSPTAVPFSGFYVSGGYFLTGEQVERRTRVVPLRPLIRTDPGDRQGLGAWEVAGRVSRLGLGEEIFKAGFADPNLWSNSATTTELGLNWYWNEYIKVYMFWLHGEYGEPVLYRPGGFQKSSDMFWLRFQLYF